MSTETRRAFEITKKGEFVPCDFEIPEPDAAKPLWTHQARMLNELKDEKLSFVVGPPAAGKTLTLSALVVYKLLRDPKLRAIFAVPQTMIGQGFEFSKFFWPWSKKNCPGDSKEVALTPHWQLHDNKNKDNLSNLALLKKFLEQKRKRTDSLNARVLICSHQSLVQSYKAFPKLFKKVVVVIDEAHHSKASEIVQGGQKTVVTNCLGNTVVNLVKRQQQVIMATATAFRGDGYGLMGPYRDRFTVAECPFDEYWKVCKYFRHFTFDFVLYGKEGYTKAIDRILGDKRKPVPKTVLHIPSVNSKTSSGKIHDLNYVFRGIAGTGDLTGRVKNKLGLNDGITLVKRGNKWVKVVNLISEDNREVKKKLIQQAHENPDNSVIDVIVGLNMFKEGANNKWLEKGVIIGYRGSFGEVAQLTGRILRDAPHKEKASLYYLLPSSKYDPKDGNTDNLNAYLKALLLVLMLEDDFDPVPVRVKKAGKSRKYETIRSSLLREAVNHDNTEEMRIKDVIFEDLLQEDKISPKMAVKRIEALLEQEGVEHPTMPLSVVARQVMNGFKRRNQTALKQIEKDVKRFKTRGIDVDLLKKSQHPLAYLSYFTEAIGVTTLAALRTALQDSNETRWWEVYRLLQEFVEKEGRLPLSREMYKDAPLGSWCTTQIASYRQSLGIFSKNCRTSALARKRVVALENIPGWNWDLPFSWYRMYILLLEFVTKHGVLPTKGAPHNLGIWCNSQRTQRKNGTLTEPLKIRLLESVPGWVWDKAQDRWRHLYFLCKEYLAYGNIITASTVYKKEQIGHWVSNQRRAYILGTMESDRIKLLTSTKGWQWYPHDSKWGCNYSLLREYVNTHLMLPTSGSLYRWCNRQRELYKKNKLSGNRNKQLESIPGWWWTKEDKNK